MQNKIIQEIRDDYSPDKNTTRTLCGYATSIKTLAEDLYAKDTHFIFELIQNAEDNNYEVQTPSLRFILKKTDSIIGKNGNAVLIVENNEEGFKKENVEAICSVGRSTKKKDQGYIGEKGIGFKSVFRVTSCPYIFSNGFRFSLPEKDNLSGLGYIVPTWQKSSPENLDETITTIYLPLDKPDFTVNKVSKSLEDVAPETIIFLKKLKKIELDVRLKNKNEIIIEKDDSKFPLVKLSYLKKNVHDEEKIELLFWVSSKEFIKPSNITHEKRQDINKREVSIAIPILNKQQGKLFAYLPVWENTGLPFLINADFLLTSSREAVKEDEPWNEWLRTCVAEVYVEAFISCLSSKCLNFEQKITSYASLPRRSNQKFLQPIIPAIQEQLKKTLCVYTAQCDALAMPHATRIAPKEFWSLLSGNNFPAALQEDVQLVCPELEAYNTHLIHIGVSHLKDDDIIECLNDNDWLSNKSNEWFVQLYRFLKEHHIEDEYFYAKKIVKTWSDTELKTFLSCSADQPIYFERDDESRIIIKDVPEWLKKIVPVSFLDREFLECLSSQYDSAELTEWMTEHLQIYSFSKTNFCIDILNVLLEKYELLSPERIAAVTKFLAAHADGTFHDWDKLPVVFNNDEVHELSEFQYHLSIVVPEHYEKNIGWQHIWVNNNDRKHFKVLSKHYDIKTIDHLLSYCGDIIKKYPHPEQVKKISQYDGANEYEKKCLGNHNSYSTVQKTITNWRPPSILKLDYIDDKTISNSLLSFLSQVNWRHYKTSIVHYFYYSPKETHIESEFFYRLQNCKWLPTQKGFVRPSQAFLPKKEIKEILGETVPYFQGSLSEDVIKGLGIKSELTIEELLKTILAYSSETNVNHEMVYRIYSAIDTKTRFGGAENIVKSFRKHNLIFIPTKNSYGQWYALENVIWEDSEKILGEDFIYLQKHYPKLKDFFLNTLGVKEKVDPESFAQRWLKIQKDTEKSPQEIKEIMELIYRALLPIAKRNNDERPGWWDSFVIDALFLTQKGEFVDAEELVVPDDGELKRIFSETDIQFVWRPEKDSFNQWAPFYEAFGIPRISESVQGGLVEETDFVRVTRNELVTPSMIAMLASWLREKDDRHYSMLLQNGMFKRLLDLCEADTDEQIKIVFTMEAGHLYEEVEGSYPVFWDHDKGVLLINRSAGLSNIKRKVSVEIAKGLMGNRSYKDLAHWIELILGAVDTDRVQAEGWPVPREISKLLKSEPGQLGSNAKEKNNISKETEKGGKNSGKNDIPSDRNNSESNSQNQRDNDHDYVIKSQDDLKGWQDDPFPAQNKNSKYSTKPPGGKDQAGKSEDIKGEDGADNVAGNGSISDTIIERFSMAFNRDGETTLSEEFEDGDFYNQGNVKNPDRRREKIGAINKNKIIDEPTQNQRRRETIRNILEPADPATREYLLNLYSGKCQICEETFPQRNGTPFFVVSYIVERQYARLLDNPANALSLCPLHFAQWRHGTIQADNILEQVLSKKTRSEGGGESLSLQIELCGKKCEILYKEKHIVDLQALLAEVINFGNEDL